ncbi:hypothetical protein HanIR_Chr16g0831781 [Helianthus annuus]|nr:hypothetical protein HanIR_Chr16g0831781 [Helianthus annuus]
MVLWSFRNKFEIKRMKIEEVMSVFVKNGSAGSMQPLVFRYPRKLRPNLSQATTDSRTQKYFILIILPYGLISTCYKLHITNAFHDL